MDKDTVILIVNAAAREIQKLFPIWYAKDSLPKKYIALNIDAWWTYVEEQQQNLESGISKDLIQKEVQEFVDQYQASLLRMRSGQATMNFFRPRDYDEFRNYCGQLVCQEFVKELERPKAIGTTLYFSGTAPIIMQITRFTLKDCPDILDDSGKAAWIINEARKIAKIDYEIWKSEIFDQEKEDRTEAEFLKWATDQRNEVLAYEESEKPQWNRTNIEKPHLLDYLSSELKHDRLKDGSSIIDWSRPRTPFNWATNLAPFFKANLCMQLLKSVIEGRANTNPQNPTLAFEALFTKWDYIPTHNDLPASLIKKYAKKEVFFAFVGDLDQERKGKAILDLSSNRLQVIDMSGNQVKRPYYIRLR